MSNPIQIIQGAQYGSEAKGSVAAHLAVVEGMDICVRTGATNAGHTVYYEGNKYVMQQLPVGWVDPDAALVIGAGSLLDPEILLREIDIVNEATGKSVEDRLMVDPRAWLHWPRFARLSAESGRHTDIGATGKGCSEALISRLRGRGTEDFTVGAHASKIGFDSINIEDTEAFLNISYNEGAKIQLEGTQGQLLDLVMGPYPYVTHKQTGPGQWMMEAGLSPSLETDIVAVVRTYPIRVAGNSGPLPRELTWGMLARNINAKLYDAEMPPLVDIDCVLEFEDAVKSIALSGEFDIPPGSDGLDQHLWSQDWRLRCRHALSSLHARAMDCLDDDTIAELNKLFEMTTVTKKLRRVARISMKDLAISARQMRPNRAVVTFMNYEFPYLWGSTQSVTVDEARYLNRVEANMGVPVHYINRGPLPEHFIKTWADALDGPGSFEADSELPITVPESEKE